MARAAALEKHRLLGRDVAARVPASRPGAPRVLVGCLRAMPDHTAYEVVLAQALRERGAEVALLTCGGGLPACEMGWPRNGAPRPCNTCGWVTDALASASGLRHFRLADELPWGGDARRAPGEPGPMGGLDPVEGALPSAVWSVRTSEIMEHPDGPALLRDHAVATAGAYAATERVLDEFRPDVVFLLNGMFAAEHGIRAAALSRGIRVPTYELAPRGGALVLSQHGVAPKFELGRLWDSCKGTPLTDGEELALDHMLRARTSGRGAHEPYDFAAAEDGRQLREGLQLPADARIVSLFSNIAWDTALQENDLAYSSMIDFIVDAVRMAGDSDATHLVVRSHPAEVKWGTGQPIEASVRARLGDVPPNVRFVGPADTLNSYSLIESSEAVLCYASTVGLEAAVSGVPVAVAADVHYRGRGFTIDINTPADVASVLNEPPARMSREQVDLARRYAFAFFFRAMVPLGSVSRKLDGTVDTMPTTASQLRVGVDPRLDFICDRILDGGEFDLPVELATDQ